MAEQLFSKRVCAVASGYSDTVCQWSVSCAPTKLLGQT